MTIKILFFFASLGVFNALIVACYFLFLNKKRDIEFFFLGVLLLLLSIRIGISCSYYFGSISFPFIKIGLIANILLGPTMLFKSLIGKLSKTKLIKSYLLHCGCILVILLLCWIVFDYTIWNYKIRFTIHGVLTAYIIYTAMVLKKDIQSFITSKSNTLKNKHNVILFLSIIIVCMGFVVSLKTTYILGPLVFSVTFYSIFIYFLLKNISQRKKTYLKKVDNQQFELIKEKLIHSMETEKIYQDANLNLNVLANRLGTNRYLLSQILNDNLKKNFYQCINEYRIEEACKLLSTKQLYSVEAIGYDVGFRSKSAFFSAFKKIKGTTPSKYKALNSLST
jgi:AraC-like DNA-binding protein